jgi:hypothetical protein
VPVVVVMVMVTVAVVVVTVALVVVLVTVALVGLVVVVVYRQFSLLITARAARPTVSSTVNNCYCWLPF